MRSSLPKLLHPLCGRPLIAWPIAAARDAGAGKVVVVDGPGRRLAEHLPEGVEAVVQEQPRGTGDASEQELAIREVNTGIMAFAGGALLEALSQLDDDNAQGELYLPDVLPRLKKTGRPVGAHVARDWTLTLGINDRIDLARVRELAQHRIQEGHMRAGVTIVDPRATTIDAEVTIGRDTVIEPATFLHGATVIGADCTIGAMTTIRDSEVGDGVTILRSHLDGARVRENATVGPFAYLRPNAELQAGAKAGTFVEIKNSTVGAGSKVPHLSYIGDADIGEGTNLGASTITANYDGVSKHRTTIGDRVHTSVDTTFVAPVTIGDDAYTGAGSVITDDIPAGALGIARARQVNKDGYAERVSRRDR